MLLCLNHADVRIVTLLEDIEDRDFLVGLVNLAVGSIFLANTSTARLGSRPSRILLMLNSSLTGNIRGDLGHFTSLTQRHIFVVQGFKLGHTLVILMVRAYAEK